MLSILNANANGSLAATPQLSILNANGAKAPLSTLNANGLLGPTTERFPVTQATAEEALAGLDNRKYMTPLRTKQSLVAEIEMAFEAVASVGFSESATPPAAPTSGRKLFLSASGAFFSIDSAGQVAPVVNDNLLPVIFSITPPDNPAPTQRWINKNDLRAYEFLDGVWVQTCGAN